MLIAATLQATGGAGGPIRAVYAGAEDFLMLDRRLTQSSRVEDTPERRVEFPVLTDVKFPTGVPLSDTVFQVKPLPLPGWGVFIGSCRPARNIVSPCLHHPIPERSTCQMTF